VYPGCARSQIITKDYRGTQCIGITMRANSGELNRHPSCYEARRIDQLKAESSDVFIEYIYTKECGCTSINVHDY
jgi:hypothetical protein